MTTIDRNFLGIRINGDITASDRKDQKPQEEFEPFVRALLDESLIDEFGWTQRTPYFNDGDPCVFSAYGVWVRTVAAKPEVDRVRLDALTAARDAGSLTDSEFRLAHSRIAKEDEERDEDELEIGYGKHPVLGGNEGYGQNARYVGEHEATWLKARALYDAVDDGHFDDVLLKLFGDHCKVKVRRDGITVDHYDHE